MKKTSAPESERRAKRSSKPASAGADNEVDSQCIATKPRLFKLLTVIEGIEELHSAFAAEDRKELYVVFTGDFNNGKSTLVNAVLGQRLLISSAVPTTGQITCLRYGREDRLVVAHVDGSESVHPIDYLEQLTTLDTDGMAETTVERVDVFSRLTALKSDLVFVDTPGSNDDVAQTRRALTALGTADAVVWVIRADAALKQGERQLAAKWLNDNPGATLAPVINFMNVVPQKDREAVRQRLISFLTGTYGDHVAWVTELTGKPFFEIDAQATLEWTSDGNGSAEIDFVSFTDWLDQLKGEYGAAVKTFARSKRVAAVLESLKQRNFEALARLNATAVAAGHERRSRTRERDMQLRRIRDRADTCYTLVETDSHKQLAEYYESLSGCLNNQTLSVLQTKTNGWGESKLKDVAKKIAEMASVTCKAFAAEFGLQMCATDVPESVFQISFLPSFPEAGGRDKFFNFFDSTPTHDYMANLRRLVKKEWDYRALKIIAACSRAWNVRVAEIIAKFDVPLLAGLDAAPAGWNWELTEDLTELKACEIRLRRGDPPSTRPTIGTRIRKFLFGPPSAPAPLKEYEIKDWKQADRLLEKQLASGQPISADLVRREAAQAAIEIMIAQHTEAMAAE